ncbi:MAG: hypothetical protein K5705_00150 [Oscillospiraceae bacterium]|nr:hypothetical protein [Oscillospiraceae bacterium]
MFKLRGSALQSAAIAVLTLLVCAGGFLLLKSGDTGSEHSAPGAAETGTTVSAVSGTAANPADSVPAETVTTAAALSPHAVFQQQLDEVLIPEYGLADDSECLPCTEQTGIACVYFADFQERGKDDMLVIRLELLDQEHAAAPVFEWYTEQDGAAVLVDTFECKMPWSDIAVRYSDRHLYVSGCLLPDDFGTAGRKYSEISIRMEQRDMTTEDMQQEYYENGAPAHPYPQDALLLMTVETDRTNANAPRRYLLCNYGSSLAKG